MRTIMKALVALLFFVLFLPANARADDVVVVENGSLGIQSSSGGQFTFDSQGMTLNGSVDGSTLLGLSYRSGDQMNVSFERVGLDIRGGSGTVNGTDYDHLFYESQIRFTTNSFTIPNDDSPQVTLVVPFTFEGFMQGCTESTMSGPCPGGWVFSTAMSGQGLATLQLSSFLDANGDRVYSVRNVTYDFTPPTATPEPATLFLLSTGLAGGIAARRRRRRIKSESKL